MSRLAVERRGARVWLTAPDGRKTSVLHAEAECLAAATARLTAATGTSDVRIGSVGVVRDMAGSTGVMLHGNDGTTTATISALDVHALADLLLMAATTRIFAGSVGATTTMSKHQIDRQEAPSPPAKGSNARAEALTPRRRHEIATKAATARWSGKTPKGES